MRLKQLEVIGLKSFANRTTLDFHSGVTAIVGPNGCGKSNVVDAIRWVLGEQSAKHLRGDSMEDIIFKGNGRIGPSGMAEVSLTFANDEPPPISSSAAEEFDVSSLPSHFRNLSEITVSRRYFRSGESEYYINRTPCRLKDITELFLGTGIGSKAYAIIEQGRVEQLINSKPEDRRLFIEEAGGTTLYRSRRIAAERKIERTRENLLRVNDVSREIERQIQNLNRLAKRAEKYRSLRDEQRDLDLRVAAHRWQQLEARVAELGGKLEALRTRESELNSEGADMEEQLRTLGADQRSAEETLASLKELAAVAVAERDSADQRAALLRAELEDRQKRESRLRAAAEALQRQRFDIEVELTSTRDEANALGGILPDEELALNECQRRLSEARDAVDDARSRVDNAKGALIAVVADESEVRNEKSRLGRARLDAMNRRCKAEADAYNIGGQIGAGQLAIANGSAALLRVDAELVLTRGVREDVATSVREVASRLSTAERSLATLREEMVKLASTLESLRQIHDSYEGYTPAVRSILLNQDRPDWILGVVGDMIEAPAQYEKAVGAALGSRVNYLAVKDPLAAAMAIGMLRENGAGRGSFIPVEPRNVPAKESERTSDRGSSDRSLADVVTVAPAFQAIVDVLLRGVQIVPDIDVALGTLDRLQPGMSVVTPVGEIIDAHGVVTGGSEELNEQEIVSRRRRIQELIERSDEAAVTVADLQGSVGRLRLERSVQDDRLAALDQKTQRLTAEVLTVERDVEKFGLDLPRLLDRQRLARFECRSAMRDARGADAAGARADIKLALVAEERARREQGLSAVERELRTGEASIEALADDVRQATSTLSQKRQRLSVLAAITIRLEAEENGVTKRADANGEELTEIAAEIEQIGKLIGEAVDRAAIKLVDAARLAAEAGEAQSMVLERSVALRDHSMRFSGIKALLETCRVDASQAEIALAEARMRLEHLGADILERYEVVIAEVHSGATLSIDKENDLASRQQEVRLAISRLGDVNTGAIEELSDLEERAAFLRGQREDLERSIGDLERTIQRLNRVSRTRFIETFAAVNERFQEILPRLLRGGEARLVLTDEQNLLETGVEIVVRPPGKRLESITLLSGGEKALVAVSLIFSLFLINPTPFCFLDEVDAPLDDANIGRFSGLVREMSAHSQFIVITHNKRTMEAANALYGVTMEEPGISKIVSVSAA